MHARSHDLHSLVQLLMQPLDGPGNGQLIPWIEHALPVSSHTPSDGPGYDQQSCNPSGR